MAHVATAHGFVKSLLGLVDGAPLIVPCRHVMRLACGFRGLCLTENDRFWSTVNVGR